MMNKQHAVNHTISIVSLVLLFLISGCIAPFGGTKSSWRVEEHVYKQTPQGDLSLFMHLPQGWKPTDKRPAIVFFFGGGFTTGKITEFLRHAEYFSKHGMVSVRADYRVKDRHGTMPDKCVEDGKSAIRWLRANARRFGIDPDRIAASGHSAGATVAACAYAAAALEAEGESLTVSSKPNLLALFNAGLDVSQYYALYLGSAEIADSLSPNDHLTEGFPPTILFYGVKDVHHFREGIDFVLNSRGPGNAVELYASDDKDHDARLAHNSFKYSPWFERTMYLLDTFLGKHGYVRGKPMIKLPAGKIEMYKMTPSDYSLKDKWDYTELHHAARTGDVESVRKLIEGGAEVDANDRWDRTPISYAIEMQEDQKLVQALIDSGADLNSEDKNGDTLLHHAARNGNKNMIDLFISKGLDVNAKNKYGLTPLYYATTDRSVPAIDLLVKKRADVNAKAQDGITPLHYAAWGGNPDAIDALISAGADVNAKNDSGFAPLHSAAEGGKTDVIEALITHGADVNVKNNNGYTPLYFAIWGGHEEVVRLLADKGADVNVLPKDDGTPLEYAVWNEDVEMAKLFVAKGARFDAMDNDGWTAFRYAASQGHRELVTFFVDRGADLSGIHWAAFKGNLGGVKDYLDQGVSVDARDGLGWTPLHWAASMAQDEVGKFLLRRGAEVGARSDKGRTPLHQAATSGSLRLVRLLISEGADVNAKDEGGKRPLHCAADRGQRNIAELLIAEGADVNARMEKNGLTPLHTAARSGHKAFVELLLDHSADATVKDNQDRTALDLAKRRSHSEIVDLLNEDGATE
jgi:ankyrin repeat protein/acetyl esterase/lipase